MTTKLPTEDRPITLDPAIKADVEAIINRYEGKDQDTARAAVLKVHKSGFTGTFAALIARYDEQCVEDVGH